MTNSTELTKGQRYYQKNKELIKARNNAYYYANKEKQLANTKLYKQEHPEQARKWRGLWERKNPTYVMYHNAKRRARHLKLPFDLSWKELVIPEVCPIFGIKLNQKDYFESTASLDRVVPSKGYTKENTVIISMRANRVKGEATAAEHRRIADYIDLHTH